MVKVENMSTVSPVYVKPPAAARDTDKHVDYVGVAPHIMSCRISKLNHPLPQVVLTLLSDRIEQQRERRQRLSPILRTEAEQHDLAFTYREFDQGCLAGDPLGS